jgi:hypothetical protein
MFAPWTSNHAALDEGTSMNPIALHSRHRVGAMLCVACLVLVFCPPAQAGRGARRDVKPRTATAPQTKAPTGTVKPAPALSALTPGMVVSIDPESGRLVVPTADEMARLSAAEWTGLLRTSAGLTEIRGPGNAVGLDLQGRFMEFTVVRLDLLGGLHFVNVNDAPVLLRLLDPRTPAPTPVYEEK